MELTILGWPRGRPESYAGKENRKTSAPFSKHVLSDIRYRKTCALTSHFVLGVGGGRMPCKLRKIFLHAVAVQWYEKKILSFTAHCAEELSTKMHFKDDDSQGVSV